jgi:integrase
MPKRAHDGLTKRCNCGSRKWPKCRHSWHFLFHHGGRHFRYSLDVVADARGEPSPASRAEAAAWRDRLRSEIRAGVFADPHITQPAPVRLSGPLTFGDICEEYLRRHVRIPTRRPRGRREMEILVSMLRRSEIPAGQRSTVRLEAKAISDITRADVEGVRTWRRQEQAAGRSKPGTKSGEVGTNRLLSRLRHLFSWAIAEGYVESTPFKRGSVTVVKMESSVEGARTRRLEPSATMPDDTVLEGEEIRLLKHAGSHLRAVIVAALSTGCRLGELLSLQWSQIRRDEKGEPRWIVLAAAKTKTAQTRVIPIGPRLRAELAMRMHGPDGKEHLADAYVFGNECGDQVTSIRTAWSLTCQRAAIRDLHFHDLRREFASRLLESSADLHDVQLFLGHANITQTSTYLSSTPVRLERALARMENAAGFAHGLHKPLSEPPSEGSENGGQSGRKLLIRNVGAEERTRTFTPLRAPAPQAGASSNSATPAQWVEVFEYTAAGLTPQRQTVRR